jgi:hypothetical protein
MEYLYNILRKMSRIFLKHDVCLVLAYVKNTLNILGRLCPTVASAPFRRLLMVFHQPNERASTTGALKRSPRPFGVHGRRNGHSLPLVCCCAPPRLQDPPSNNPSCLQCSWAPSVTAESLVTSRRPRSTCCFVRPRSRLSAPP